MNINWKKLRKHLSILSLSVGLGFITQSEQILAQVTDSNIVSQESIELVETMPNAPIETSFEITETQSEAAVDSNAETLSVELENDKSDSVIPDYTEVEGSGVDSEPSEGVDAEADETAESSPSLEEVESVTPEKEVSETVPKIRPFSVEAPVQVKNQWEYSDENKSWTYYNDLGEASKQVSDKGYFIDGERQTDSHISINGQSYYYDPKGELVKNNDWFYSNNLLSWFRTDETGRLINEVTPWGHYVNGGQVFDKLVTVADQSYYFEPLEWGGTMAFNKWSYSPIQTSWYFSELNGAISKFVTPEKYTINDEEQTDTHISILGTSFYYDDNGNQLRNNQAYSNSMNAYFRAGTDGVLDYEVTPWGHYVNGEQQFDTTVNVDDKEYYFEPLEWGGTMAFNKWSFSPLENSWYFSNPNGVIGTYVTPNEYKVNGVAQKDAHVSIHGTSFYYLPTGQRHVGGNVYSDQLNSWFKTDNKGVLNFEVTPWGHYINGQQKFDALVQVGGNYYYFEPAQWHGTMAFNKWSYSPLLKTWTQSDTDGVVYTRLSKNGYFIDNVQQFDTVFRNGYDYYYFSSKAEGGKLQNYRKLRTPVEVAFDSLMWPGANEKYSVNMPLMLQTEPRWSHSKYGTDTGGYMIYNGCAIVSLAMVESYLEGEIVTPDEVANWAGLRHWVPGVGTSWGIFSDFAYSRGYRVVNHGRNYNSMTQAISNGSVGIVSVGPGKYTTGGHLMAIRGYNPETNALYINDPNDSKSKQFSINPQAASSIRASAVGYWTFTKR